MLMNLKPICFALSLAALGVPLSALAQTPAPFDNPGVTSNPEQGEIGALSRFSITYENERGVLPNPYQYSITVTRYGEEDVLMGATAMTDSKQYNIMHITLDRTLRDPGAYVVTLPAGFAQNWDYEEVAETKWLYIVTGDDDGTDEFKPYTNLGVDISPRQGIYPKLGEDFRLNFDYKSIGVNPAKMIRMIDDANGVVCGTFSIDYTFTDDHLAVLNQLVLKSDREITVPGSYTLEFPEGTFYRSSDSENIGAFKFRYVVNESAEPFTPDPAYSFVYPSSGSTLRELDRIVVTFPDFEKVIPAAMFDIKVTDADGNVVSNGTAESAKDGIGANQVAITFEPVLSADGEYTVTLGDGTFVIDGSKKSNEIVLNYAVNAKAYDPADPESPYDNRGVAIFPEQGRYKSLNTFVLTFDCEKTGINFAKMVMVYNDETGAVFGTCGIDYGANFGREVIVDVLPWMNVPGIYTIEFLAGTFYDYGSPEEEEMPIYKFRYVIDPKGGTVEPVKEQVTADPVSGSIVRKIDFINVTFPEVTKIERSHIQDDLNVEISVIDANGDIVSEGFVNPSQAGLAPNTMQIKFDPAIGEIGNYDIVFARRVFLLGEEGGKRFNEEFKLNYSITESSITDVEADGTSGLPAAIYNLQGVRVDSAAAPGTYITVTPGGEARKIIVR